MKTLLRVRCLRSRRNSPNFWNWTPKHVPDQKKHVAFRKSLNHSTLLNSMLSIKIRKVEIFSNIFHTYNEYEVLYSILLQSNQQDLKNHDVHCCYRNYPELGTRHNCCTNLTMFQGQLSPDILPQLVVSKLYFKAIIKKLKMGNNGYKRICNVKLILKMLP